MTENHPITPPPELLQQWATEYWGNPGESIGEGEKYIATQAARWGADQELEACCKLLYGCTVIPVDGYANIAQNKLAAVDRVARLRAARRPKAPSLAEQALAVVENSAICDHIRPEHETTLRADLERLKELEQSND